MELESEYRPLASLVRLDGNAKDHDIGLIVESLRRFGFIERIIVNRTTGRMLAGHGRLDALQSMKAGGQPRPERIVELDGDWGVPVDYVKVEDGQEQAVSIALNRLVELGGWNEPALVKALIDLAGDSPTEGLRGTGFDAQDLDRLVAITGGGVDPFDAGGLPGVPEPPEGGMTQAYVVAVVFVSFREAGSFERGLEALTFGERNVQRQDSKYAQIDGETYLERWEAALVPGDGNGSGEPDDDEDIRPRFLRDQEAAREGEP